MSVAKMGELSWKRPGWLRGFDNRPSDIKTKLTAETEKEARIIKDMMTNATLKNDVKDEIFQRYSYCYWYRESCTTTKSGNWKDNQGLW